MTDIAQALAQPLLQPGAPQGVAELLGGTTYDDVLRVLIFNATWATEVCEDVLVTQQLRDAVSTARAVFYQEFD